MVLPAIPLVLAGAARALGSAAVRKLMKQGISQDAIRKMAGKEASKKAYKKLKKGQFRRSRDRANEEKFKNVKTESQAKKNIRREDQDIQAIAEGGMRNPRLFGLKMKEGGKVKKDDLTPSEKKLARRKAKVEMSEYRGDFPYTGQVMNYLRRLETAPDATAAGSAIREFGGAFATIPLGVLDLTLGQVRKKLSKNKDVSKAEEKRLVKMFEDRMKKVGGKSGRPSPLTRKGREEKAATQEAILSGRGITADSDVARDALLNMSPKEYRRRISDYGMRRTLERDAYKKGGKVKSKVKKMRAGGPVGNGKKKADGIALRGKTRCKMR